MRSYQECAHTKSKNIKSYDLEWEYKVSVQTSTDALYEKGLMCMQKYNTCLNGGSKVENVWNKKRKIRMWVWVVWMGILQLWIGGKLRKRDNNES